MKKVNGIQLLQMLQNDELAYGTKIHIFLKSEKFNNDRKMKFYTIVGDFVQLHLYREEDGKVEDIRSIDTQDLLTNDFYIELKEDDENMKKDIEKIKEQLKKFMETYNVTVDIETICEGRTFYGKIISPKVKITINSLG